RKCAAQAGARNHRVPWIAGSQSAALQNASSNISGCSSMGRPWSQAMLPNVPVNAPAVEATTTVLASNHNLKEQDPMPLNIGSTGNGKPYLKYNAKADKWFVRGTEGEDQEIQRPSFVVDFDNTRTGWLRFREGQAPERVIDPSIDHAAPNPGEGFKRG